MSEKISNSSLRLKEMMEFLSLKQSDIVSRTGITKSALSNYIHGTREPRQDQISKIADPYKINPSWLMGYDVPMFMDESMNTIASLNNDEDLLLKTYRSASDEEKRMIVEMLAFFKSKKQEN